MKKLKSYFPITILIILVSIVTLFYASHKSGMFIDEIYTFGLSNGYYTPFVTSICEEGTVNHVLARQDLLDYLTVSGDDAFALGSVYYNQSQDVHPPLHYWIIHIVSSFFRESYSKWIGIVPNLVILLGTCLTLYALAKKSFENEWIALMGVGLYGLSTIAISTAIMIRMYMLLTFFTVLLAYWILHILQKPAWYHYLYVGVTILLGLLTQYYFVFYAFFVCAACVLYLLIQKRWRNCVVFSACALSGVILLCLFYPACIDHLFSDKLVSGGTMVEKLFDFGDYFRRIHTYVYAINYYARIAVRTGVLAALACLIMGKRLYCSIRDKELSMYQLVIFVPAFIALIVVAIASPVIPLRYAYNLIPIFVYAVCYVVHAAFTVYHNKFRIVRIMKKLTPFVAIAFSLIAALQVSPEYLYPEHLDYNVSIEKHTQKPCVYFDDNHISPLTQDLLQLVQFEEVFVANDAASEALGQYLASQAHSNEIVVYIDIDSDWSSGFDSDEVLEQMLIHTGYGDPQALYQYGSSEAYLLTKIIE